MSEIDQPERPERHQDSGFGFAARFRAGFFPAGFTGSGDGTGRNLAASPDVCDFADFGRDGGRSSRRSASSSPTIRQRSFNIAAGVNP
jgi:hypothetical protein